MRDINGLKNAFGKADDGFQNNVYLTLANLKKGKERFPVKRLSLRLVAVIAAACIMITGTALALTNTWGILDYFNGHYANTGDVLPDAAEIVQIDPPQAGGQSERAVFSVREAVYDGQNVYIAVEAKSEHLLLDTDLMPSDPVHNLGSLFSGNGTIAEYAGGIGKTLGRSWVRPSLNLDGLGLDCFIESDGTSVTVFNFPYDGTANETEFIFDCGTIPFIEKDGQYTLDMAGREETTLTVTLQNTGIRQTKMNIHPVIFEDCGVQIDRVTLTSTEMAVYFKIAYTVIDQEAFALTDGGLFFEFLDENGEIIPDGPTGSRTVTEGALTAMETLPDKIVIRGYNCWESDGDGKLRYEAHEIEMK